jgi:hypothetical protein
MTACDGLDGSEQVSSREEGRKKLCNSFLGRPRGSVAVKDRGGRGEKEFFDKSCESIKKLMQRLCEGQIDGRQAEGRRSWFEGR